ncbi:diacylglycerol kinase family protein [Chryseobacterium sp. D764]|jgi:diacylglycerol kinase (ATP)|uniref:diacylglycerol kinase family protein n=1 Tax=unclassified Chryseobacterium TaxID=2593645 RepID=UPI0015C1CF2F|nr:MULTISPECIES: diacylglycerol kinase family protein [unclassified Chryseobacterium]QXU50692.1 diacylglycerol kinase family protein [Chryseobacterium sp. D764]CAD0219414.1 Diacylglycerol kinase [Chryseobacterium sp. JV274]
MQKPPIHKSFLNAFRGVFMMIKTERNFQIELLAFFVNLFFIFYFKLSSTDAALVLIASFAVLSAEIFNTAIEKICDIIQPDYDKRIGFIKDIAAGAVVLTATASVIVGILVYGKYILRLIRTIKHLFL